VPRASETVKLVQDYDSFTGAMRAGWVANEIEESRGRTVEILRTLDPALDASIPRSEARRAAISLVCQCRLASE
jgi:hypothetical protein